MGVGSLPVPSVQALVSDINGLNNDMPDRYNRIDELSDPVYDDLEIPIIDMSKLLDPDYSSTELNRLHLACKEWGFFQLINHSIDSALIERIKAEIWEFFNLPLEKKKEFSQLPGSIEGYGQQFVMSEDQKLDWADILYYNTQPLDRRITNIWPPSLRDLISEYSTKVNSLANVLTGIIARNLGVSQKVIDDMFTDGVQSVRVNYYPPCPQAEKAIGFSPHSDGTTLTLLLQLNEVHGLQMVKNGGWLNIKPIPGAFIGNLGDAFEVLSNGIYKSIVHRCIVNKEKVRLTLGAFHSANMGSMIGPLHDIVKDSDKALYKTVTNEEYLERFFSAKLYGHSFLNGLKK